ncbi:hypothetical protein [Candidatus Phytoplasma sacchari]|nr:hypothetical protein [Candidatus Phytoplasma sacchari]KAB8122847.1 hypothetical protein F2B49_00435 [Candidatus Phytoplasma sacchari]
MFESFINSFVNYTNSFVHYCLFLFTLSRIYKQFITPCYYIIEKKYKICFLRYKNIKRNINHIEKKCFIHLFYTIETCLITIALYPFLLKLWITKFGHNNLFWFNFFYILYIFSPAAIFIIFLIFTKIKRKFKKNR